MWQSADDGRSTEASAPHVEVEAEQGWHSPSVSNCSPVNRATPLKRNLERPSGGLRVCSPARPVECQVRAILTLEPAEFALQFASTFQIESIILAGTLSQTSLSLVGGGSANAASAALLYVLLPSAGSVLQAGVDLGVLTIETVPDQAVPEPATGLIVLATLAAFGFARRMQ